MGVGTFGFRGLRSATLVWDSAENLETTDGSPIIRTDHRLNYGSPGPRKPTSTETKHSADTNLTPESPLQN